MKYNVRTMNKFRAFDEATELAPENEVDEESSYEFVRPFDPVDNVLKLESALGLYSNVIVAASYREKNNKLLTSNILFHALRIVIEQHPSLYVLGLKKPSSKKPGTHIGWKGRLKSINLEDCVSFIDDYDDSERGMLALHQKTHNEWFELESRTKPLWRLIVVNRVHVLFVWQHLVCDGRGAIQFHQSLLAALNEVCKEGNPAGVASTVVSTSTKPLPTDANIQYKARGYKAHMLATILQVLWLVLFRLWYGKQNFFFNDAVYTKKVPALDQVKVEERCVTSMQNFRFSATMMAKILVACKKNKVTFTAFLSNVIDITLATDVYPKSKARLLNRQVDLRRYLPQDDNMTNMSSTTCRVSRVYKYRQAGQELPSNTSLFWELARDHTQWLKDHLSDVKYPTPIPIRDSLLPTPEDEEGFASQLIPNISLTADLSYTISNLGMVDCDSSRVEGGGPWSIDAMNISCCATKSNVGSLLSFSVMSLKGGECVVNVIYEKGVLTDERVREIIEKVNRRLVTVI